MIITRTPFRISFAGGGSDLRNYYEKYGGAVVSTSINKYVYLSVHPYFFKNDFLLKYSQHEEVNSVDKIQHRIIKQLFKDYKITGVDFNSSADIPAGTGLASSSAFTSGLINLCNAYTEKYMTKEKIAEYACEIEIEKLKEPIGKQDQYACAVGGLNYIQFNPDETVSIEKICLNPNSYKKLEKNLLMFYTGQTRSASDILKEQKANIVSDKAKIENLHKMVSLAKELKEELLRNNIDAMGEILHKGWVYKRELASGISNPEINHYYDLAVKNGAMGGKLLGAGGGGFFLFYAKEEDHPWLRQSLSDMKEFKFKFDNLGTTIIHYEN
jgi:D-glycero-alpha-D-manno-heptose-7-phosphate kinase